MKVANAPCSWGNLEFGLEGDTYEYAQVLDEMASTGFEGTELGDWGFLPTDPQELIQELKSRRLDLLGAFVPINFVNPNDHEAGLHKALKVSRLLAEVDPHNARLVLADDNGKDPVRTQNAGRIQSSHSLDTKQWKIFTKGVEYVAKTVLAKTGISSVFHHHCAGYIETSQEIDLLLEKTDPDLVGLCFDTGHYKYGGGDVMNGLKKHKDRIKHIHFKDFDLSIGKKSKKNNWDYFESLKNGIFCELGKGSIDFKSVLTKLEKYNLSDWIVVEQDVLPGMGSPKENAKRNRQYLKSIGI
jgi:inosose dehydratase